MKDSTFKMVKLAIEADDTVSDADRKAILACCRDPVPRPIRIDPPPAGERYLRPREAADALKVNIRTVQRWVHDGALDSRKVVGIRRIPWSAVQTLGQGAARPPEVVLPGPTDAGDYGEEDHKAG